jgi:hypothetical protein
MPIEAPLSKHSRTNCKLGIVLLLGAAIIFAYDGYLSQFQWSLRHKFYEDHSKVLLFRIGAELLTSLDKGVVPPEVQRGFEQAKQPLSAAISPQKETEPWVIADGANRYSLQKDEAGLAVYRDGPDDTMVLNQVLPFFFVVGAALLGGWFWSRKGMKVVAADNELVISAKKRIPYDAIEKIDKTHFESRGFFTITYKTSAGREANQKLSGYTYDNLRPLLDHLIAKIT